MKLVHIFLTFDECFRDPTRLCSVSNLFLMLQYNIFLPAQNLRFQHIRDHLSSEHMRIMDPIELLFNKISMPFHVPFVMNSSFQECTKFQASIDFFQALSWINNIALLNLLNAISSLSNIQDPLNDRVIVLTLFCTFYLPLHISLVQNSIWQFGRKPRLCLIKYPVIF